MSFVLFAVLRRSRFSLRLLLLAAALFGFTASSRAQVPAVPAVPAVPTAPGAVAPAVPAAPAAPANLWSFLCPTADQKAACKEKLCKLPITQLLNNTLQPVSLISGGLVTGCCPTGPTAQDLAAPADSAEGAAARIQKSEAEAKKRRLAVRYLGTVDCHYWPEAEAALIGALRTDTNECVRYEAALALTNGCCCTKPIMEALLITVSGSNADKNPSETSVRVREQARIALDRCLCRFTQTVTPPDSNQRPEKPEKPMPTPEVAQTLPAVYTPPAAMPITPGADVPPAATATPLMTGQRSLYDVMVQATPAPAPSPTSTAPVARPAASGSRDLFTILQNSLSIGQ